MTEREKGERKQVTVVFADISGFTALSEKLDPEYVRDIINACFSSLVPIVEKYGGHVDKFIGDLVMALFGAPVAHENDAERALRAALEMMQALTEFNTRNNTDLGMHIGINSGLVVAGGLGSEGRQQYSVIGDTVNLASRLEDASATGQILVGANTYHLTSSLFDFETLAPLVMKGKADPVPAYRLTGLKPVIVRGITGRSPVVGRDAELEHLRACIQKLSLGQGSVIAITGEPGMGKSRLIAELHQFAESNMPGLKWAEGYTQSYMEGNSYWVARSMLNSLAGLSQEMTPVEAGEALLKQASAVCGTLAYEVFPYLARLREVPLNAEMEDRIKNVLPEAMQERMHRVFGDLVREMSRQQPVVMAWEDLHWVDASSLKLLETLLPLAGKAPVMIILTFRPNEGLAEAWHQRISQAMADRNYKVINLSPLTHEDSTQLIGNLFRTENIPADMRQAILDRAEGNPFFLEELMRSFIESGYVKLEGNNIVITGQLDNPEIPDTLQGVIAARIDRLSPEEKHTLQSASVLGRVFQQAILEKMAGDDPAGMSLNPVLAVLQQKELIHRHGEMEYIFKHAVTQEVTYNSLLIARRKELHRKAAGVIEVLFPGQLEELSATLAHHYECADAGEKAILYLRQAGDRARKTFSNADAVLYYQSALKQVDRLQNDGSDPDRRVEQTAQLYEGLGDVYSLTGHHEEARSAYQDALEHVPANDLVWLSRLHRKTGVTWKAQRLGTEAQKAYDQASAVLGPVSANAGAEWHQEYLELALLRLEAYYFTQSPAAQMQELADSIALMIPLYGTPVQRAKYFSGLCLFSVHRNHYRITEESLGYAMSAVISSKEADDRKLIATTTFQVGFCHLWLGDYDQSEARLQAALDLAEQIGDRELVVTNLSWLSVMYRRNGQVEKVRSYTERSLEEASAGNIWVYMGIAKANQARIAWHDGKPEEAQANARNALEIFDKGPIPFFARWLAVSPLIDIALHEGKDHEAVQWLKEIVNPAQMHMSAELEEIYTNAILAWDNQEITTARMLLQQGISVAKQTGWM